MSCGADVFRALLGAVLCATHAQRGLDADAGIAGKDEQHAGELLMETRQPVFQRQFPDKAREGLSFHAAKLIMQAVAAAAQAFRHRLPSPARPRPR